MLTRSPVSLCQLFVRYIDIHLMIIFLVRWKFFINLLFFYYTLNSKPTSLGKYINQQCLNSVLLWWNCFYFLTLRIIPFRSKSVSIKNVCVIIRQLKIWYVYVSRVFYLPSARGILKNSAIVIIIMLWVKTISDTQEQIIF